MNNALDTAEQIVRNAHTLLGAGAVHQIATYGYRGALKLTTEELCEIQDFAKEYAAHLPESLFEI